MTHPCSAASEISKRMESRFWRRVHRHERGLCQGFFDRTEQFLALECRLACVSIWTAIRWRLMTESPSFWVLEGRFWCQSWIADLGCKPEFFVFGELMLDIDSLFSPSWWRHLARLVGVSRMIFFYKSAMKRCFSSTNPSTLFLLWYERELGVFFTGDSFGVSWVSPSSTASPSLSVSSARGPGGSKRRSDGADLVLWDTDDFILHFCQTSAKRSFSFLSIAALTQFELSC